MNNKEKMISAMRLMSEACKDIIICKDCPFTSMCNCLLNNDYKAPLYWEEMFDLK